MKNEAANTQILTKLVFRLLPAQVLLAAVGSVNSLVSGYFASNYVGIDAMSAVGLFGPINMLLTAISMMLVGGSVILCGKYLGQNEQEKLQDNFSLNLLITILVAAVFTLVIGGLGLTGLTGIFTKDAAVRPLFDRYLTGQAIGVFPLFIGNLLTAFLSIENRGKRTIVSSIIYIIVNILLNFLFVRHFGMETFGLALASSFGLWVFMFVQAWPFLTGRLPLRLRIGHLDSVETSRILRVGFPGAASNVYQTLRGFIVNSLIMIYVGSVGISAFSASDNVMRIFWAVPVGMTAVSRLLMSVSIGEEDRQTLTDVMRIMFKRFLPIQGVISLFIIICAVPFTRIFFQDPAEPVYMMTVWGFRILPLCMPFSIICMHFTCYGQASGKQGLVHLLSVLDGVVCVVGFSALLVPKTGMNGVYIANVLNGVVTTLVIIGYALLKKKRIRTMEDLMVVPDSFGAPPEERLDLSIRSLEEVVSIAERVQAFCLERGVDSRRAYLAGLALEEMAGNIVDHGFTKDAKRHSVDVRVVHKDDDVILRLKDDCVPFDPGERQQITAGDDMTKNIGIRMVFKIARDIQYQNMLGLNVLTIRI